MKRGQDISKGSDVRTPLLEEAVDSASDEKLYRSAEKNAAEYEKAKGTLCDAWATAWKMILAALLAVIFPFRQQRTLTEQQEERLRELWCRTQIPFDSDNPKHVDKLKELWKAGFPDVTWKGQKSNKWTEMGWQGSDPATDFRGGGLLALECLCDLHRLDPQLFRRLMTKSEGTRSEWEYPFAVAGVNLTFGMTEMLQLRMPKTIPGNSHARGFLHLLDAEDDAFSQLFCISFALLDKNWLEMKASYMEFPLVMQTTRRQVEEALAHQPRTTTELKRLLAV